MFHSIKVRLYPIKSQEDDINKILGACRFVYNQALAFKNDAYQFARSKNSLYFFKHKHNFPNFKKKKIGLKEREFICQSCGVVLDRDLNAAINLRNEGTKTINDSCCNENVRMRQPEFKLVNLPLISQEFSSDNNVRLNKMTDDTRSNRLTEIKKRGLILVFNVHF